MLYHNKDNKESNDYYTQALKLSDENRNKRKLTT